MPPSDRNFNTISPSAKSLLLRKGHTNIPFARQTAELISLPGKYVPDFGRKDFRYWTRVVHFESRYFSIDQLLAGLQVKNILELSSGYSFRGLDLALKNEVHYIDTDLPDMTGMKNYFKEELCAGKTLTGKYEILPLNALDEVKFREIIERFPPGEIAIVNEGLLMYLDWEEKEKLCGIINNVLKKRGGCWITADVYINRAADTMPLIQDEHEKKFFAEHQLEEKKFNSFEEAEELFKKTGFVIDKEAVTDNSKLSSVKYLLENSPMEELLKLRSLGRVQATWRLKSAG
jgi:hypothetical protein